MHCGNCPIVDYCTHPHETPALCCVQGLQDVDIDDYKKLAEQVTEEEIQIKISQYEEERIGCIDERAEAICDCVLEKIYRRC